MRYKLIRDRGLLHGLNLPSSLTVLELCDEVPYKRSGAPVFSIHEGLHRFVATVVDIETVVDVCDRSPHLRELELREVAMDESDWKRISRSVLHGLLIRGGGMKVPPAFGVVFPALQALELSCLGIKTLAGVPLPTTLKSLTLRVNPELSLAGVVFPASLTKLYIYDCPKIQFNLMKIPGNLEQLSVHSCKIGWISMQMVFPPNLKIFLTGLQNVDARRINQHMIKNDDAVRLVLMWGQLEPQVNRYMRYDHQDACMWVYRGKVLSYDLSRLLRGFLL
jgi:hypothetical protein